MAEVLARRCDDSSPAAHVVIQESQPSAVGGASFTPAKSSSRSAAETTGKLASKTPTTSRIPLAATAAARNLRSPRCEAFVMTGDKMLILNPKISPHYAKMHKAQLPPAVELYDGEAANATRKRGPFDDFPSMHHHVTTGMAVVAGGSHHHAQRSAIANGGGNSAAEAGGLSASRSEHLIVDEMNRIGDLDNEETENSDFSVAGGKKQKSSANHARNGDGGATNYSTSTLPDATMADYYYGSESGGDGIGGARPSMITDGTTSKRCFFPLYFWLVFVSALRLVPFAV